MIDRLPGSGEDDVHPPAPRSAEPRPGTPLFAGEAPVVAAVAVGGAVGALARYGLTLAMPTPSGGFPTATFLTNVTGCLFIGALIPVLAATRAHRLLRPLLATGVLGGFTTFSTYTLESQTLLASGRVGTALAYLAATVLAAVVAAWTGAALVGRVLR